MKTTSEVKAKTISRLNTNSKIIKTIIEAIHEKKGVEVVSLNLKKIPEAVSDFFIICEANNPNNLKAIADNVEKKVLEKCGEKPYRFEGKQGEKWILIDYINVVVHCMLTEVRYFYNLEEVWHDAERKEHTENKD
ncbi:MAG TPA: ribosome silencing factor [Chitinophagaceae bacterium]|nr:ribosome silencing factor [Chitinophagaceae bacterium]